MATPVGTPPNLIGIGMLERITGTRISFFTWMAIGVPLVLVLFAALVTLFTVTTARGVRMVRGRRGPGAAELRKLGRAVACRAQRPGAFGATVLLWTLPGFLALAGWMARRFSREYQKAVPEGVAAMIGALLLFVLPVDWRSAPLHVDVGRSRPHRLGHRLAVRRRAGAGRAGVFRPAWPRRWAGASRRGCRRRRRWR